MKILDTLGKTKKAIGGVVAICILAAVIFFAGTVFGGIQSEPKITSTALTQSMTLPSWNIIIRRWENLRIH